MSFWSWIFSKPNTDSVDLAKCKDDLAARDTDVQRANDVIIALQNQLQSEFDSNNNAKTLYDRLKIEYDKLKTDYDTELKANFDLIDTTKKQLELNINLKQTLINLQATLASIPPPPDYNTLPDFVYQHIKTVIDAPINKPQLWMNLENTLWKLFSIPDIKIAKTISGADIKNAITAFYPDLQWPPEDQYAGRFSDAIYQLVTIADARRIFLESFVGLIPYLAEFFDCEEFAKNYITQLEWYHLDGLQVWGDSAWGPHSYLLQPCSDGIVIIEPQLSGHEGQEINFFKVLPETISQSGIPWIPRRVRDI